MLSFSKVQSSSGLLLGSLLLALLEGCSMMDSSHRVPAPVEERQARRTQTIWATMPQAKPATERASSLPPDQPGFYTVRPGDTLIRIGLDQGQNWRDLAKWNNLDNPNSLEVGQQLRVQAPTPTPTGNTNTDIQNPSVIVRAVTNTVIAPPITASPAADSSGTSSTSSTSGPPNLISSRPGNLPPPTATTTPNPALASSPPQAGESGDELSFAWPAHGSIINYFDENKTLKGLDIGGKAGDAVQAAADGKVVYAGNGLRGYGNLVILKHNNTYLSAYAHNQTLLVKEDQSVKKGQKIAEMGSTDSDQVNLHFEIRKLGKPIDPIKYLPAR